MNCDSPHAGEAVPPGHVVFLRKTLVATAWLGALACLAAWAHYGGRCALGLLGGMFLGAANLVLLAALVRQWIRPGRRSVGRVAALLAVKMLLVYGGLAALLSSRLLPAAAVVIGISLPLVVISLKAGGRALQESRFLRISGQRSPMERPAGHSGRGL